jgi:hypothetical protein
MGVELEVNGFKKPSREALTALYNLCVEWHAGIGTDGSCGDTGVEIRTAPACNGTFVKQLTQIIRAMKRANAVIDERCGLHVHVDVRDLAMQRYPHNLMVEGYHSPLDTICRMWTCVEPTFYRMVDVKRPMGKYCKTWPQTLVSRNMQAPGLMNSARQGWFEAWNSQLIRYQGLNLQAYHTHKTVEFRLHQGTLNRSHIIAWAQLCAAFIDACETTIDPIGLYNTVLSQGDDGLAWLQSLATTPRALRYIGYQDRRRMRMLSVPTYGISEIEQAAMRIAPGAQWTVRNAALGDIYAISDAPVRPNQTGRITGIHASTVISDDMVGEHVSPSQMEAINRHIDAHVARMLDDEEVAF